MRPTLASQRMVGMITSILPKKGKTNEYGSRACKSEWGHIHNINTTRSNYLYDRHIMILNAKTCHKNEYKSNITITQEYTCRVIYLNAHNLNHHLSTENLLLQLWAIPTALYMAK
jgi:hypothetical protein